MARTRTERDKAKADAASLEGELDQLKSADEIKARLEALEKAKENGELRNKLQVAEAAKPEAATSKAAKAAAGGAKKGGAPKDTAPVKRRKPRKPSKQS